MKKIPIVFILLLIAFSNAKSEYNETSVELTRELTKEIFQLNGIPYLQPLVESINSTSNSRFFHQAYVPEKVDKPYFRVSVNGMTGFVKDDMLCYTPQFPTDSFDIRKAGEYASIDYINGSFNIKDTVGLMVYLLKNMLYDGVKSGDLRPPEKTATILGNLDSSLTFEDGVLQKLAKRHPAWGFLPKDVQDSVLAVLDGMPSYFSLPKGADMSTLYAAVPQFEIGSWHGTEALIRFIPPVNMGETVGEFAFWGLGLKHSLSQYFDSLGVDIAVQAVYQGTSLENSIGETNADMKSNATFWNFNLHAGKRFGDYLEIYSGISVELVNISADYKYYLPVETQAQLGLLRYTMDPDGVNNTIHPPEPELGYPGDTKPQTATLNLNDQNVKFTFGLTSHLGPVDIYLDFSFSRLNILSGGLAYRF